MNIFLHLRNIVMKKNKKGKIGAFTHGRGGKTVAMEPVLSWVLEAMSLGDFIERKVGKADCSLKDLYCKKVGRQLAESRMKTKKLILVDKVLHKDWASFVLQDLAGGDHYMMVVHKNVKVAFFAEYWVEEKKP